MSDLDDSFLRELMEGDDDATLASLLLTDDNQLRASMHHMRPSTHASTSNNSTDEKIRMLERQLEEQKRLLSSIMDQKGASNMASKGINVNEKRKLNRARLKREQEAMERELELKAQALIGAHDLAQRQNQELKQRLALLESSVRLREETLAALSLQSKSGKASTSTSLLPNQVNETVRSFAALSDPKEGWDARTCQTVRRMTQSDYCQCWKEFVSEAVVLATAIEAHQHPHDHPLHVRLASIVSHALAVTDQVCSLNPKAYYSSLDVNLVNGMTEKIDRGFWLMCLKRISLEDSQIDLFKLAMEEHHRRVVGLMNERSSLAADLTKLRLDQPWKLNEISEKLTDNVQKEAASTGLTIDLLTLKVLSPLQIAMLCGAAFPLIPDPTEIASVAIEMIQFLSK